MQIGLLYLRPSLVTLRDSCHMLGGHPQEPPGTPPLCTSNRPPPLLLIHSVAPTPQASHTPCTQTLDPWRMHEEVTSTLPQGSSLRVWDRGAWPRQCCLHNWVLIPPLAPRPQKPRSAATFIPTPPKPSRSASALLTALGLSATDTDWHACPHLQRPPPFTSPGEPPHQSPCLLPSCLPSTVSEKEGSDPLYLSLTAASPGTCPLPVLLALT